MLQEYLLKPVLGIEDPRTDERIDFIGGIRGLEELERRVQTDMTVAFAMYPTSIGELFAGAAYAAEVDLVRAKASQRIVDAPYLIRPKINVCGSNRAMEICI